VSQEWLESNRRRISGDPDFVVESDANELVDLDGDGQPDKGWTRQQLYDWLTLHDIRARAGLTKAQLLGAVREALGQEPEEAEEVAQAAEEAVLTEEVMNGTALVEGEAGSEETAKEQEVTE
tara:strand:+ start:6922 stop:7287 length:366 start_codon:yes stop_codon:yes gene_type:complete